ncbi:Maf family protein [Paenibacillus allorhizosphaerae]|uniref:dTTP/UTP pyrophosphatase n=1 Tax=Paenibacillus allorhizosphaerae TaxID=2849866 RepID=A0ABM8VRI4_9BACL|nr:Maf family protein [Paenibacillus allorhizosphaerae]CAG7655343.1 dTTP/UTP pyrophosphatase [Paenibacillus allorhizosphaerae]
MSIASEKTIILASSSPRRQELIRSLNRPYEIIVSSVDETTDPGLSPAEIVEQLSSRKAQAVYERCKAESRFETGSVIVGSDTIVVQGGEVLGKPKDAEDAFRMLRSLQGRGHQVYSGVAVIDLQTGVQHVSHRKTNVRMKPLADEQIRRYIATGEPMDKAGAYGIQGLGATIVEEIEGDYFSVVGLPMSLLSDLLARFSIAVF